MSKILAKNLRAKCQKFKNEIYKKPNEDKTKKNKKGLDAEGYVCFACKRQHKNRTKKDRKGNGIMKETKKYVELRSFYID